MTAIQELIDKYSDQLKHNKEKGLSNLTGESLIKIVLVDLISYQVKEKEQIVEAYIEGCRVDAESDDWISDRDKALTHYIHKYLI